MKKYYVVAGVDTIQALPKPPKGYNYVPNYDIDNWVFQTKVFGVFENLDEAEDFYRKKVNSIYKTVLDYLRDEDKLYDDYDELIQCDPLDEDEFEDFDLFSFLNYYKDNNNQHWVLDTLREYDLYAVALSLQEVKV